MIHISQEPSPTMHRPLSASPSSRHHGGFTLIEIMMAIGILTVATAAVVGRMANLQQERQWTTDVSEARYVMDYMIHSLQAMNWDDLNNHARPSAYLFWARHPDGDGVDNDTICLGDDPGLPHDVFSAGNAQQRLIPVPPMPLPPTLRKMTRLDDLRVYVEYYRAVTARDSSGSVLIDGGLPCTGGLLENPLVAGSATELDTANTVRTPADGMSGLTAMSNLGGSHLIARFTANGGVADIRLLDTQTISSQVGVRIGEMDPVAVRISVTWRDRTPGAVQTRMMMTAIAGKGR